VSYSSLGLFIFLLLVEFSHVETLVDIPWDWPDFRPKLLLNSVEGKPVVVSDQVDGNAEVSKPSTSADPVEVSFGHLGEVEVDDDIDSLDVDTSGEQITADEIATETSSEIVEDPVTVSLSHLGVDVIAGISKLSDLLGQQLDPLCGVAENDALVYLKLGEEGVQAMHLLSLLHKGIVLGDPFQCQLVHQVYLVWVPQMLPHECLHGEGEGGGVQEDLPAGWQVADHPVQHPLKILTEQLVCLV